MNQIRTFDYLHLSSNSGLQSDSNFWFHYNMYKHLFQKYPDKYHFLLTVPNDKESVLIARKYFDFPNVTLIPIKYLTTSALSRYWFDMESLQNQSNEIGVFDVLFCNTPDVMPGLQSFFQSRGYYSIPMNYFHWIPQTVSEPIKASYRDQLAGWSTEAKSFVSMLISSYNGCNSEYGKKLILDGMKFMSNEDTMKEISSKTYSLPLVPDKNEILQYQKYEGTKEISEPIILFNYRKSEYTGFSKFMKAIQIFVKNYPTIKFKIAFTSVGGKQMTAQYELPSEYVLFEKELSREEYMKILWQSDIQLGTHIGSSQWSLSFMEGMFAGSVPLFQRNVFFDELFKDLPNFNYHLYSYEDEKDFSQKLLDILTNLQFYKDESKKIQEFFLKEWSWENLVHKWDEAFNYCYSKIYESNSDIVRQKLNDKMFNTPIPFTKVQDILVLGNQRSTPVYLKTIKNKFSLFDDMTSSKPILSKEKPSQKSINEWFK